MDKKLQVLWQAYLNLISKMLPCCVATLDGTYGDVGDNIKWNLAAFAEDERDVLIL